MIYDHWRSFFFFFLSIVIYPHFIFFFFNDTATTEIYTLSLHDALPIFICDEYQHFETLGENKPTGDEKFFSLSRQAKRSEEHTSELQSRLHLVCRLLLEKKKKHTSRLLSRPCLLVISLVVICQLSSPLP